MLVHRAGEVIPQVIGPILSKRPADAVPYELPKKCPVCGSAVIRPEGEAMARCTGGFASCVAQRYELLTHFVGRGSMDIEIGRREAGLVAASRADWSTTRRPLLADAGTAQALERMGDKSAQNVLDNIDASKERPLTRVFFALGIRYVGYQNAELLARAFGTMDRLRQATLDDILAVEGIGPKIAESVYAWFQEREQPAHPGETRRRRRQHVEESATPSGPLAGLTIVVTGRLEQHSARANRAAHQRPGWRVGDSVCKKTTTCSRATMPARSLQGRKTRDADHRRERLRCADRGAVARLSNCAAARGRVTTR